MKSAADSQDSQAALGEVIPSQLQKLEGHENLLPMVLPSIDNVSTLKSVSRIAKNVPLCLLQRRTPFPMLGNWALGS